MYNNKLKLVGVVTDLASVQGPLFVCERVALDKLMFGLVEPCVCGQVQWCACSVKQVNWINLQVYIIVLVETNYILVNEHSLSLIPM